MSNHCDEPVYLISNVATMLNIHPQTLRQYEREGLVSPLRTNGKIRLYSQVDIDQIKYILYLTRELGVNISGIKVILKKDKKLIEYNDKIEYLKNKLDNITRFGVAGNSKALVVKKSQYDIVIITPSK